MSVRRYVAVVGISLLVLAAYSPLLYASEWWDKLSSVWNIALMLSPVAVSFVCSITVRWWERQACFVYCLFATCFGIFGMHDRTAEMCCYERSVWDLMPQMLSHSLLFIALPSALAWAAGRLVYGRLHRQPALIAES